MRRIFGGRMGGFTLSELMVVIVILGILIGLAVPRYLAARKNSYKEEANNLIQEAKTLEWAYYQQWNSFDPSGLSIGFGMPGGAHWGTPSFAGNATSIRVTISGTVSPLSNSDSIWLTLQSDGSSSSGSSF